MRCENITVTSAGATQVDLPAGTVTWLSNVTGPVRMSDSSGTAYNDAVAFGGLSNFRPSVDETLYLISSSSGVVAIIQFAGEAS